jgi:Urm1 (Ubiquitin related modifier)
MISPSATALTPTTLPITVEFTCAFHHHPRYHVGYRLRSTNLFDSGGLEMLFSNQKKHSLEVPTTTTSSKADSTPAPRTLQFLVDYLCETVMTDSRKELFVLDGTVYVHSFLAFYPPPLSFDSFAINVSLERREPN